MAVVPYRQDQSPRLDFWGTDVRNDTREGDTLWVNYNTSPLQEFPLPGEELDHAQTDCREGGAPPG